MSREAINNKVVEMIRHRYSIDDELGLLRTGPSEEAEAYSNYVELCRAWGRGEKTRLGTYTERSQSKIVSHLPQLRS